MSDIERIVDYDKLRDGVILAIRGGGIRSASAKIHFGRGAVVIEELVNKETNSVLMRDLKTSLLDKCLSRFIA